MVILTTLLLSGAPQERCQGTERAIIHYRAVIWEFQSALGERRLPTRFPERKKSCAYKKYAATKLRLAARKYRKKYAYHFHWWKWLPDKWQRIGACETGYGKRPGNWKWNSGTYQGAFGFYHGSWDAFVRYADPKAGPYPSEAYLATPRQQYEVALAIWRRYGFSGWGCKGA